MSGSSLALCTTSPSVLAATASLSRHLFWQPQDRHSEDFDPFVPNDRYASLPLERRTSAFVLYVIR